MTVKVVQLGRTEYGETLRMQEKLLELRQQEQIEDTFLLVEHQPVLTLGKRGKKSNIVLSDDYLKQSGIDVFEVNRGGDVTYHGPGQIVGYPILNLKEYGRDVRKFVWNIEEIFVHLLDREYGIKASRINKFTGVWVGQKKITSIGFAVKRWVTMHGFAFNVNTNLEHFKWIVPCGIKDKGVTSLKKITGEHQDLANINSMVIKYFCEIFKVEPLFKNRLFLEKIFKNESQGSHVQEKA